MKEQILELNGICKDFPGVKALSNVNISFQKGEIHALMGENGAGKSTLIKILTGAHKKTSGKIKFNREELNEINPEVSKKMGINAIYQELTLFDYLPIYQNIFMGQEFNKKIVVDEEKMIRLTQDILKKLELKLNPKQLVKNLSIAEKQMIEIARALMFETKILIMDEPTSSISKKETEILFKTIKELKEQGITIIYISHRIEEIFELCDKVTILRDGKSIKTLKIEEILNEEELVNLMVDKKIDKFFPDRFPKIEEEILKVKDLEIKNIFGPINFSLKKGEILGIGGLVGSKRSELVEAIFALRVIDKGDIILDKKKVKFKTPTDSINNGFGLITEDRKKTGLFLQMGVRENITMAFIKKYLKNFKIINFYEEKRDVKNFIKRLKIKTPHIDQKIQNLSGGNQQKALIARWLLNNPKILMMDEPTRGIDVKAKTEIYNLMNELTDKGVSIIMISSEIPELLAMSDSIMVMCEGKISGFLNSEDKSEENVLKLAFGGA